MSEPRDVPALEVKNLTVVLGGYPILEKVSFTVPVGQTTAIIGPNGAGKSVLLKTLLGLLPKRSGEVFIFGQPHERYHSVASLVSYIPQHLAIDPLFPLTVRDLFSLKSSRSVGLSRQDETHMEKLLSLVGMEKQRHQRLSTLSGGQVQRVLLGYSLMDYPRLLLLDEPSAGIDVQGQETIYTLLKRIQHEVKLTMVLISHELEIVMNYADQVLCLNRELICSGVPKEVLSPQMLEHMYGMPVRHFIHHPH